MKLKSLSAVLALVLSLFVGSPAQASSLECFEKVGYRNYCGMLGAADISQDGRYIYAIESEQLFLNEKVDEDNYWDLADTYRIVRIQVSNSRVTQVLGWQTPEVAAKDIPSGGTRLSEVVVQLDVSPDGRKLLLLKSISEDTYEQTRFGPERVNSVFIRNEISVIDLKTKRETDLSKTLKLQDSGEQDWGTSYESVFYAFWSSNSKEVRFLLMSENIEFNTYRVSLSAPTRMRKYTFQYSAASGGSRYGTSYGEGDGDPHILWNMITNKRMRTIKGTELFDEWKYLFSVLPKDTGREFFAVFHAEDTGTGSSPSAVYSIDARGKRKLILEDQAGIYDIKYANRGKLLLVNTASNGWVLVRA